MPDDHPGEGKRSAIEAARSLEARGLFEPAIQEYLSAGAPGEAARLLVAQRKFAEAGQLLIDRLGVTPENAGSLDPARKKLVLQAAVCLSQAGETIRAAVLFAALGDRERAAETLRKGGDRAAADRVMAGGAVVVNARQAQTLERAGNYDLALEAYAYLKQYVEAARMAIMLGRTIQAAEFYQDAGMHYEAADFFARAAEPRKSLDALLLVSPDDRRYRQSCLQAVRLASDLDAMSPELERFLDKLLSDLPQNDQENEAFLRAADLYEKHKRPDAARAIKRRLVAASPAFGDGEVVDSEAATPIATQAARLTGERTEPALPRAPVRPPVTARPPAPAPVAAPPPAPLPAASFDELFAVDSVVANRYRIEARIGRGGMAIVFRAFDLELNERIAMKVFTQQIVDEHLLGRFKQELSLSRQLHHPNIIRLYDIGQIHGCRYITMELLRGKDLRFSLGKPLDAETGIGYLLQVCSALQHVHEKGVVHRDIKPANLFLTDDGIIKLMDFGIAKRQATPGLTVAGTLAGTPEYMSPEQINGFDKVKSSTDLYAVGIMAYEMFSGSVPFRHKELMPLLVMQMQEAPKPPSLANPAIPPEMEAIIMKLLEKDPVNRFATCAELIVALQQV